MELTKHPTFTRSPSEDSSPSPTSDPQRKLSKNKRMLPVVPGVDEEPNGNVNGNFKHSETSPFQTPQEQEEYVVDESNKYGTYTKRGRKSRGSVISNTMAPEPSVAPVRRTQLESKPKEEQVWVKVSSSLDTECLLKDTEDYMKSLESRVRQNTFSTSPDHSEGVDTSQRCDADESDVDTTSNVSNIEVESSKKTWQPSKGRHQRSRSDFSTKDMMEETKKDRKRRTSGQASSVTDSTSKKSSSIWSRLSTPYKHKVTPKDPETMSDTGEVPAFRRNSVHTASLPGSRRKSTSSVSQKEAQKKAQTPKLQRKSKSPLPQPRQTRSTMLRKSRFEDQDTSELSDVSPKSSISDLGPSSYSKKPPISKSSTSNAKAKQVQSRLNSGQTNRSSQGGKSARSDVSLGAQISQLSQTQIERERVRNQTRRQSSSSAKSNFQAKVNERTDPKPKETRWRRYESTGSETEAVNAYIKSVNTRKQQKSQVNDLKNDSRRRRASVGNRSQLEVEQRQYFETSIDDVIDCNGNGTTDDRLSRGEGDGEAQETEQVAKDEVNLQPPLKLCPHYQDLCNKICDFPMCVLWHHHAHI
ncbi:centrosomal protein of 170 kDa-like [Anneissia japonica]|uniref:centrosomal protein of 170 kDa-like n=1 Tax=Anneissia japonica TaxID=1529436 RepID=UPI001425B618|nr:centrosomal protein of 170 kDa-like [Anneissia japonica]